MASRATAVASKAARQIIHFKQLDRLPGGSGDEVLQVFRASFFNAQKPIVLPHGHFDGIPATTRWFNGKQLNYEYLERYAECMVPIEVTRLPEREEGAESVVPVFSRNYLPLYMFLQWAKSPLRSTANIRLYLAQCQLLDLLPALRADFEPTPELVMRSGKGDIYDTNVWLGLPPTYTPLHRDPNPNIFVQLAGTKVVRLCPPDIGFELFQNIRRLVNQQDLTCSSRDNAVFRGEEMMHGPEKDLLEEAVWKDPSPAVSSTGRKGSEGYEVTLNAGDGLFIPMGWWHSLKSVGDTISGSVNWWFR
ncbi:JmjC domain-containing protein [Ascosphaera apis ARSEF 7405]|uniref:JmjC domain-containing protein n=1 Tax=Ascosphaera apis ARSEF 7405 TaxID=392613 RepID=A0A167V114_9EURO|nr:JmjC domain-containing protein [Ascosphaera apis ARSEF 7405]